MNAPDRSLLDSALPAAPYLIACTGGPGEAVPPPEQIGFKAYNLARMAALGLPVPPAFVLGTAWCAQRERLRPLHWLSALQALERCREQRFGDARRPLLLSVRSGAAQSMPGMMESLLNIGLCDHTLPGLLRLCGNPRLAWDAYRRLVASYGEIVMNVPASCFEADLDGVLNGRDEQALDFIELRQLTRLHQATVLRVTGRPFPQEPRQQLAAAIDAVFASWMSDKACQYRRIKALPDQAGTAVTVQAMVFGNAGGLSGAGVGFTRQPMSGEPQPWLDFLFNAQGEDVVSGRRSAPPHEQLGALAPELWNELLDVCHRLEAAFGDMQDIEFTVELGRLWILQARAGKRSPQARARIALDLLDEGLIDAAEALQRTQGLDEAQLGLRVLAAPDGEAPTPLARGISASAGVVSGLIALDEAACARARAEGRPALLLRPDADTRDIAALEQAQGLLTARGARTSHAAVVARQLGKVCVVACEGLHIDERTHTVQIGTRNLLEGAMLTVDGNSGEVYEGVLQQGLQLPQDLIDRLGALRQRTACTPASTNIV